jgi:hypothetical protein
MCFVLLYLFVFDIYLKFIPSIKCLQEDFLFVCKERSKEESVK